MALNKTDMILCTQRLHEAIRLLPEDAKFHGAELIYDSATVSRRWEIHLSEPVEWPAVFDGNTFGSWKEKRIAVSPFAFAWWAENLEVNDNDADS